MKSAFSKPGFLADKGTFSSRVRKEIPPMRRAQRVGKVAALVQRSKERWRFMRTVGERARLHACHSIDFTTGTSLADNPPGHWPWQFDRGNLYAERNCSLTMSPICLPQKKKILLSPLRGMVTGKTYFISSCPSLSLAARATFIAHCGKCPIRTMCSS